MDRECPVAGGKPTIAFPPFLLLTTIQVEVMIERRLGEDFDTISKNAID